MKEDRAVVQWAALRGIGLGDAKAEPRLKSMVLVNNTRLSVQPVSAEEWKLICKMGGLKA